jgi:hypothetical protein
METVGSQRMFHVIDKIWNYAEGFITNNDFGLTPVELRSFKNEATVCFIPLVKSSESLISQELIYDKITNQKIWNSNQTLRFAVGASMISLGYRRFMDPESLRRSIIAKTLFKSQMGLLDDLIDNGNYNYSEAKELYRHVVGSMSSPDIDCLAFQEELNSVLNPNQLGVSNLVTSLTNGFNNLYLRAPMIGGVMPYMLTMDQKVIDGQALTVLQKEHYLDLKKMKNISNYFFAPEEDLKWHEKLAHYISGGTRYNLIDIAYTNGGFDLNKVDSLLMAWYFYDIVVVLLNNIVNIDHDLRNGIYNLSLIDMKDGDVSSLNKNDPGLTLADYERHILRNAEIAKRALAHVNGGEYNQKFYRLITLMIPIVMMSDWIGTKDDLIELFLTNVS